jgi:hypothetical protein
MTTITHAAILAAVERLPEHLDGPAAIADALCNALGVEVPVKRAPWASAFQDWAASPSAPIGGACIASFKAGALWAMDEALEVTFPDAQGIIGRALMGQEQQP